MAIGVGVICQSCKGVKGFIDTSRAGTIDEIGSVVENFYCQPCFGRACNELGITPDSAENSEVVFKQLRS